MTDDPSQVSPFPAFNRLRACRYGQMLYNMHDMYIGRSLDVYGEFSEGEVDLFRLLLRRGDVVVDAGANIGAHTVFFAQRVGVEGLVLAFEPQRVLYQTLCANVALNSIPNVMAMARGLAEKDGSMNLPSMDYGKRYNFGGVSLASGGVGEAVMVSPLDAFNLQQCALIKVDVEGMEEEVLRGASALIARCAPILYVENDRPAKAASLVRYIHSLNYQMYWHRPALFNANNFLGNSENVFGEIVSHNMICVPPQLGDVFDAFERVLP